jgi:hypothetical protein
MMRTFNVLAVATLIGSATAAYSVKYETILVSEKMRKRELELQREKDAIAVLQAEWQVLNRPARLQALAPPEAGMQPLSARQIIRVADIPQRGPAKDAIADALDGVLTGSLPTPKAANPARAGGLTTPVARPQVAPSAPRPATGVTPKANTSPRAAAVPKAASVTPKSISVPAAGAPLALRPPAPVGVTPRRADAAPVPRQSVPQPQR